MEEAHPLHPNSSYDQVLSVSWEALSFSVVQKIKHVLTTDGTSDLIKYAITMKNILNQGGGWGR